MPDKRVGVYTWDKYNAPSGPHDYREGQLIDEERRRTSPDGIRKSIKEDDAKRRAERDAMVKEMLKRLMSGED